MPRGAAPQERTHASVFSDRSRLDYDWVPGKLWHREAQISQLTQLFQGVLEGTAPQRALITGPVGTGKTALAKWFCNHLQEEGKVRGRTIEYVWVNCRKNAAEGLVLLSLLQHFDKNYPSRGYGVPEMLRDLRKHVDRRDAHLVVLLDEADALVRKETELVYALTRFDDERTLRKSTLSLLLVSAREDLHSLLDEATRSSVKRTNQVQLHRYDATQLRDIVADRAKLAFHKGTVDADVIELISDVAGEDGDARYAIELLEGAGRTADEENAARVEAEHVRAVKAHTRSVVSEAKIRLLHDQALFALLGIARKLARSRRTFIETGEAEEAYSLAAEEHGDEARGHTQFWKYLTELETADWITLKKAQGSSGGLTQRISLEDLPAKILAEKVASVLAQRKESGA